MWLVEVELSFIKLGYYVVCICCFGSVLYLWFPKVAESELWLRMQNNNNKFYIYIFVGKYVCIKRKIPLNYLKWSNFDHYAIIKNTIFLYDKQINIRTIYYKKK
jgi:hypothetical protein